MKELTAIIVDDELDSRETLRHYLKKFCPHVTILKECKNIIEAKTEILKQSPQLVFLDIEMPHGNAFDLLEQWDEINFEIIFITAYSDYAVQAFSMSASHYLLKPLDINELKKSVNEVSQNLENKTQLHRAQILMNNLQAKEVKDKKLVLPLIDGFEILKVAEILYCEAQDNFTIFHTTDGRKMMICRNLKFYDHALSDFGFSRIHRSTLINMEYLKKYIKGKGGTVILENGKQLTVSNGKKEEFLKSISKLQ